MAIQTITEPDADARQVGMYNRKMRRCNRHDVDTGEKFAVCLLKLNGAVNQPGDYATLKSAVEGITGITEILLLIDGQAPAAIPVGMKLTVNVEGHIRIDSDPDYVPE